MEDGPTLDFKLQFLLGQRWLAMQKPSALCSSKKRWPNMLYKRWPNILYKRWPNMLGKRWFSVSKWKLLTMFIFNFHFLNCSHAILHVIYLSFRQTKPEIYWKENERIFTLVVICIKDVLLVIV